MVGNDCGFHTWVRRARVMRHALAEPVAAPLEVGLQLRPVSHIPVTRLKLPDTTLFGRTVRQCSRNLPDLSLQGPLARGSGFPGRLPGCRAEGISPPLDSPPHRPPLDTAAVWLADRATLPCAMACCFYSGGQAHKTVAVSTSPSRRNSPFSVNKNLPLHAAQSVFREPLQNLRDSRPVLAPRGPPALVRGAPRAELPCLPEEGPGT
jgi:hypothetical protein